MIDRDRLVKTFCDLVQIDSESGNETAKAEELTRRLECLGFNVETDDYGNVIAHEEGDSPFMLSGHLDTVSPGNGIKPIVDGDRIASDGTTIGGGDDNAGLAIILETLTSMREDGTPSIPVEVVLTREEEPGLIGAHKLDFLQGTVEGVDRLRPRGAGQSHYAGKSDVYRLRLHHNRAIGPCRNRAGKRHLGHPHRLGDCHAAPAGASR